MSGFRISGEGQVTRAEDRMARSGSYASNFSFCFRNRSNGKCRGILDQSPIYKHNGSGLLSGSKFSKPRVGYSDEEIKSEKEKTR